MAKISPKYLFALISLSCIGVINGQTCSSFSTYFGGNQSDDIKSLGIDAQKNTYAIGNTYSADLTVTAGLINDSYAGGYDGFVCKFDSCGLLLWNTYIGGSNFDSAEKLALTLDGGIVVCGYTSSLTTFTTNGCFQNIQGGSYDCFITKISSNGQIIWSTYFGKSGGDFAFDVKVDTHNNIVIGGTTTSTNLYTTSGSFQQIHKGNTDAFIAKFNASGQLLWSTYYGGNNSEDIHALAIDNNDGIIGVGGSFSTNLNTSAGAFQNINEGSAEAYIIKLDSSGARIFSTYFGGSGLDDAWGVVSDAFLNIYITGHTNSPNFDTTSNAYQTLNKGFNDMYLSKWSGSGALLNSTLFGGSGNDNAARLVLSSPYEITLLGKTESTDIPLFGASTQTILAGSYDALIVKINTTSLTPIYSSYFGGATDEDPLDIAVFKTQYLAFCGSTNSINFPVSTTAYQPALNNSVDGMVTKLNIGNLVYLETQTFDLAAKHKFLVWPNPFKEKIYVKSEDEVIHISIYDVLGNKLISSPEGSDQTVINTQNLDSGSYSVLVTTASGTYYFKLIK